MKVYKVYKILPAFVFINDKFVPKRFGALTIGIFIFLKKKHENNEALIQHELEHVKQFYKTFGMNTICYLVNKKKRIEYEASAYAVQLFYTSKKYFQEKLELFSNYLATKYNTDITPARARRKILEYYDKIKEKNNKK